MNRFPVSLLSSWIFLDDVGRRATVFKVEHQHFATVGPDFFTPGNLFWFIVAAFHQQIGKIRRSSACGVSSSNDTTQSTASSAPSTIIRYSSGLTGRESPFSRLGGIAVHSDNQTVTQFTGICQIRDARRAGCQKTPLVITTFHRVYALPLQQASVPLRSSHQSRYLHVHVLHFPARSAIPWMSPVCRPPRLPPHWQSRLQRITRCQRCRRTQSPCHAR